MKKLNQFLTEAKPRVNKAGNLPPDVDQKKSVLDTRKKARDVGDTGKGEITSRTMGGDIKTVNTPLATPKQRSNYVKQAQKLTSKTIGSQYGDKMDPIDRALVITGRDAQKQKADEGDRKGTYSGEARKRRDEYVKQVNKTGKTGRTIGTGKNKRELNPVKTGVKFKAGDMSNDEVQAMRGLDKNKVSGRRAPISPRQQALADLSRAKSSSDILKALDGVKEKQQAHASKVQDRMGKAFQRNTALGLTDPVQGVDDEMDKMNTYLDRQRFRSQKLNLFPDRPKAKDELERRSDPTKFQDQIADRKGGQHKYDNTFMGELKKNKDGSYNYGDDGISKLVQAISDPEGKTLSSKGIVSSVRDRSKENAPHPDKNTPSSRQIQAADTRTKHPGNKEAKEYERAFYGKINNGDFAGAKAMIPKVKVTPKDREDFKNSIDSKQYDAIGKQGLATAKKSGKGVYGGDLGLPKDHPAVKDANNMTYDYSKLSPEQRKKAEQNRSDAVIDTYLSQGGVDAYSPFSGVVSPKDMDLEHMNSMANEGGVDNPNNWFFGSREVNQGRKENPVVGYIRSYNDGTISPSDFKNFSSTEGQLNDKFKARMDNYVNEIETKVDPDIRSKLKKSLPRGFDMNSLVKMDVKDVRKLRKKMIDSGVTPSQARRLTPFSDFSAGKKEFDEIRDTKDKNDMRMQDLLGSMDTNKESWMKEGRRQGLTDEDLNNQWNKERERAVKYIQTYPYQTGDIMTRNPGPDDERESKYQRKRGQPSKKELESLKFFGYPKKTTRRRGISD